MLLPERTARKFALSRTVICQLPSCRSDTLALMADDSANQQDGLLRSRVVSGTRGYYGWTLLVAATIGMMMTAPGQTLGVSVFLDHIVADLNLSRSAVSLLYTFGTLTGALSLPFIGRFIDRHGLTVGVVVISTLFALAVGILGLGMAVATALFPLLIEGLIGIFEWRGAYVALGALVALIMLPVGSIFYRVQPERYGLEPDGAAAPVDAPQERNYTLAQVRRTRTFWLYTVADFLVAMLSTALVFHRYSIMEASGLDRVAAATIFVPSAIATAGANLLGGVLMDRVKPRFLLSFSQLLQAVDSGAGCSGGRSRADAALRCPARLHPGPERRHQSKRACPLLWAPPHRLDQGTRQHHLRSGHFSGAAGGRGWFRRDRQLPGRATGLRRAATPHCPRRALVAAGAG